MFTEILDMLLEVLINVYSFFEGILGKLNAFPFYITMIVVFFVTRFLIMPVIGGRAFNGLSDAVKRDKSKGGK